MFKARVWWADVRAQDVEPAKKRQVEMKTSERFKTVRHGGILQRHAATGARGGAGAGIGRFFGVWAVSRRPGAKFGHSGKAVKV